MKLRWLGHSCFVLESLGSKIITDPYRDVRGMKDISAEANAVYCSHGHFDHAYTDKIRLVHPELNPFAVTEIESFHDNRGGKLRGPNTIRRFESEGLSVVHLGDLGHIPDAAQLTAIGKPDVLLIPVGGTYTIDAAAAKQVAELIDPKVIIPMHYRQGEKGFEELSELPEFTALFPAGLKCRYESSELEITKDMTKQIAILKMP